MVRIRLYVINIWKRESKFHEHGTEIGEFTVYFRSYVRLLSNKGRNQRSIYKDLVEMYGGAKDCLLRKLRQDLLLHFQSFCSFNLNILINIFHFHICSVCFSYQIVIFQHSHLHSYSNLI